MPFPSNAQYVPLKQNNVNVVDPVRDVSPDETDIVGDAQYPAAYYAYDGTNVYFRMRLNTDPRFKSDFRNFAWGVLFDTDNNPSTYEWELLVNGLENKVQLIANTVKIPNVFTDQAEGTDGKGKPNYEETICNFDIARAQPTEDGSALGNTENFFIDFFIPVSVFFPLLGITDQSSLRFLFFTATNANNFNKDFIGIGTTLSTLFCDPVTIAGGDVRAQIALSQTVTPTTVIAAQQTSFRGAVTLMNTGRSAASTLFVQAPFQFDKLISFAVTQTSLGTTAFNSSTKMLTWNVGNLVAGGNATLTYEAIAQFNTSGSRTVDTKTAKGVDSFTGGAIAAPASSSSVTVTVLGGVTGTIIDKVTGLPLVGASVQILSLPGNTLAGQTVTDSAGVYSFPNLPAGSYNLAFSFPSYQSANAPVVITAGNIATVNLTLSPVPAAVNGTVRASGSGLGIAGATVTLTNWIGVRTAQTVTDATGAYTLPGIVPSYYRVSFSADGFQATDSPLTLVAGETRTVNVTLQPNPGTVTGTITNAQTLAPITGALVEVLDNRNSILATATTNALGSYTIASLAPATNDRLRISADTFVTQVIGFAIQAGQTSVVNAALSPFAGTLAGTITDNVTGAGLAGASIRVFTSEGITLQTTMTDANGNYAISSLAPGSYSIVIADQGYAGRTIGASINAGATTTLNVPLSQLAGGISGTVKDITGAPIADVIVRVFLNNIIVARVATLEDGSYSIGNLTPGVYYVSVRAEGFGGLSFSGTVNPGEITNEDFVLTPNPGSLSGVITDNAGNPIAGAVITLSLNVVGGGLIVTRYVSQTNGSYLIENLFPAPYLITVSAVPYQSAFQSVTIPSGGSGVANFSLLPDPGTLNGTVVDQLGNPVAGASVLIKNATGSGVTISTIFSDMNGHFETSALAPGSYTVLASAANFQTASATVAVKSDSESTISLILLPDPGSIRGQVTDAVTGLPIFGVLASVTDSNNILVATLIADDKSEFLFEGLPPGSYTVAVRALHYQSGTMGAIVSSNAITPLPIALQPNPGIILGEVSPAIGGANIQLFNSNNILISSAITNPDGSFGFLGEAVGSYYLTATAQGFSSQIAGASVIADTTTHVTINLSPNPGSITGFVLDPSGNPISTAVIKVLNSNESIRGISPVQGDGSYVAEGIPVGPKTVIASAPDFSNEVKGTTIGPGQTISNFNFTLTPDPGTINGQITDSVTGQTISSASIEIRADVASGLAIAVGTSTPFGNYQISGLQPGSYTVIVKANDYSTGTVGAFVFSNSSTIANVSLNPLFGIIDGSVTNAAGQPISNNDVKIKLFTKDGTLIETAFVSADGTFRIAGVLPNEYILTVAAPGFETETIGVTVRAGISAFTAIQLTPQAASVSGTARNATTGAPISGALVSISDVDGIPVESTFTDNAGAFLITGVPVGNFIISITASGFGTGVAAVVTRPGQTATADLQLTPSPGAILGFVSDLVTGTNISGAEIQILDASTGALVGTILSNNGGQYDFPSLAPGSYKAIANASGYAAEYGGFTIAPGETTRYSFALQPLPGRVAGTVTNAASGAPLAGVTIQLLQFNNFGPALASLVTDSTGRFDLGEVAASNYAVTASLGGFVTQQTSVLVLRNETAVISFALQQVKAEVDGKVTGGLGSRPLPGGSVVIVDGNGVIGGSGVTDKNGDYVVPSTPVGDQTVVATVPGVGTTTTFIPNKPGQSQSANLNIAGPAAPIIGRTSDNVNDAPIPGAILHVLDSSTNVVLQTAVTDLNGIYATDPVPPGNYTVTASAPLFGSVAKGVNTNASGSTRVDLTLQVEFGTLRGTIRDASGKPLNMALAEIVTPDNLLIRQIISNPAGQYALTNITAGVPNAAFSFPGKQTALRMPTIINGQTTILDIILLDEDEE
ncbi:beta strand repeat-containing protein [Paenibacillus sp. MMS18-CY102]|uniref:beta strand repeat-containing protein n=1 Tax=Paenibacillus sp. MMS18-CY102 TaxID=2682849 RepID=UPI00136591B4|nr:carboxypeptidase regulatory-like domain-containing protein [Paenibacillus sp. MMS18-CY102]MWC31119.1 hypothetical protein [Paenibacillus sp. MMS18-CY102]